MEEDFPKPNKTYTVKARVVEVRKGMPIDWDKCEEYYRNSKIRPRPVDGDYSSELEDGRFCCSFRFQCEHLGNNKVKITHITTSDSVILMCCPACPMCFCENK